MYSERLSHVHVCHVYALCCGVCCAFGVFPPVLVFSSGTGEAWLAQVAMEKGLVDQLATSDEYIRSKMAEYDVIQVEVAKAKGNKWQALLERGQ